MAEQSSKILVTGASGFIGRALCESLTAEGASVRALLRDPAQAALFNPERAPECFTGDLADPASLEEACTGVDAVVHLAAIASVNNVPAAEMHQANVVGTHHLLEAAIKKQVNKLVLLSSSLAVTATTRSDPASSYARSKLAAESLVRKAQSAGHIHTTVLRAVQTYGAGMGGNLATMISLIDRRRLPPLPALETRLSLVGVADLVQAIRLSLSNPASSGRTYFVTDGEEYRMNAIEEAIYGILGRQKPGWRTPVVVLYGAAAGAGLVNRLAGRRGGIGVRTYQAVTTNSVYSSRQIQQELGYAPTSNFYEQLPAIAEAVRGRDNN